MFFALELIGAIANKVNPDFRARELEYILKFSNSRAFVCPREFKNFDYVGMAKALQQTVPGVHHIIVAGGGAEGAHDLDQGLRDCPPIAAEHRVTHGPGRDFPHGASRPAPPAIRNACCTRSTRPSTPATCSTPT